jgi:hypothetical protein
MSFRSRLYGVVCLALLVCLSAGALDNSSRVWFVPWKVLDPDTEAEPAPLTLFWVPASPDELRRSELLTSRALTVYASRCVAMYVVRHNDTARLERVRAGAVLPSAILIRGGVELARVDIGGGTFGAPEVEAMVRRAIDTLEVAAERSLDEARRKVASGDRGGAVAIYREVARERCAFPRLAKEAQRALRKLGEKN